jgi:hypothetical protein
MGILEILSILTNVVPKLIAAGQSVYAVWDAARDALGTATPDGQVDPDAAAKVKALVDAQLAELSRNAREAEAG